MTYAKRQLIWLFISTFAFAFAALDATGGGRTTLIVLGAVYAFAWVFG